MFEIDTEQLIAMVEKRPAIWDKTCDLHRDRYLTKKCWQEIFNELRSDYEELDANQKNAFGNLIMKKWINARDCFKKAWRKQMLTARSGGNPNYVKKYIYNDQLQFLKKVYLSEAGLGLYDQDTFDKYEPDQETDHQIDYNTYIPNSYQENNEDTLSYLSGNEEPQKSEPKVQKHSTLESQLTEDNTDRHLSFFKGILPSINTLNDDEVLEFQMEVLRTIRTIKKRRRSISATKRLLEQIPSGIGKKIKETSQKISRQINTKKIHHQPNKTNVEEEECEISTEETETPISPIKQETQPEVEATSSNYKTIPIATPKPLKRKRYDFNPKENRDNFNHLQTVTDSYEPSEQTHWGNIRDEHSIYGEYVANEIRSLEARTQVIAKHLINNVLFQAAMGKYDTEDWHQISSSNIDDTGSHFIQPHFMECSASVSPSSG